MKCITKLKIEQTTCPGTLHLQDRRPVFINVYLFGRIQRSHAVYPSFPMVFNCKFQFKRVFTNAKTPEQVLEILEDEDILIELRQECKRVRGGNVIAQYEEVARKFLFPAESNIPKQNQLQRDVLLTKTRLFNDGKGLNPQITFKTKTIIEAEQLERDFYVSPCTSSRLPYVAYQDTSYVPPTRAKSNRRKMKQIDGEEYSFSKNKPNGEVFSRSIHNKGELFSQSLPVYNTKVERKTRKLNKTTNANEGSKHCICECPNADGIDLDEWVSFYERRMEKRKQTKPFRTGKDPDNLISKRRFGGDRKEEKSLLQTKHYKGLCRDCKVPLKTCVLCNAYKTVYGGENFLSRRLQQKKSDSLLEGDSHVKRSPKLNKNAKPASPISGNTRKPTLHNKEKGDDLINPVSSSIGKPDALFENVPMSTPFTKNRERTSPRDLGRPISMINSSESDDDNDVITQSQEIYKGHQREEPLVYSRGQSYRTVDATESFNEESERIHNRIKDLMKKNESVLQYELSSSESDDEISEEEETRHSFSRVWIDEPPNSTSSRKSLPVRSIVTPTGSASYFEYEGQLGGGRTRRDVFDSSLKHHYKQLYEDTAGSRYLR